MSGLVKPYGDTMNDGKVQLSFTLPLEWSEAADEAARQLAVKMGLRDVQVVDGRRIADGFSFFVVYASTPQGIDAESIQAPSARAHAMSMEEIDAYVAERIGRKVRVAGACIGTDAHTVGIDAILNMKGYKGDYGLERYHGFETIISEARSAVEDLVAFRQASRGRMRILASQVVTQKGSDLRELHAARRTTRGREVARPDRADLRRTARDAICWPANSATTRASARNAAQRSRSVRRRDARRAAARRPLPLGGNVKKTALITGITGQDGSYLAECCWKRAIASSA